MQSIYHSCRRSVAYVTVELSNGQESIGTAFHIGQGYFVTAKHVLKDNKLKDVVISQPHSKIVDYHALPLSETERPRVLKFDRGPFYAEDDVAVFTVKDHEDLPYLSLCQSHEMHKSEDMMLLSKILCIGYPPIPLTRHPFQVAVDATVSALMSMHGSNYLSFVVSATARGGFSGGPMINSDGKVIGLATDSLVRDNNALETGFMAGLSITAAADLALKSGWDPDEREYYQYIESLASIKLALSNTAELNPHAFDLQIHVYDDDRDVYIKVNCFDDKHRAIALEAFSSVCPINIDETDETSTIATPVENPPSSLLKEASIVARDTLYDIGYTLVRERYSEGWAAFR